MMTPASAHTVSSHSLAPNCGQWELTVLEKLFLAHLDALFLRALLVSDIARLDRACAIRLDRRRAERGVRRCNTAMALVTIGLVVLVNGTRGCDALGYSRVLLGVSVVVHRLTLVVVRLGSGGVVLHGLVELVRSRLEADAAHRVRGHELGDVVQLALERAVPDLERLLRLALARGLVQELAGLRGGRAREVGHLELGITEGAVLPGRMARRQLAEAWKTGGVVD